MEVIKDRIIGVSFVGTNSMPPATREPAAATATAAPPAAPAAPNGLVQLRTSEASWVEVRDARGQLLLSRTVQPGESVGLDGSLPMRLVIGNAAVTQLGFRGKPVRAWWVATGLSQRAPPAPPVRPAAAARAPHLNQHPVRGQTPVAATAAAQGTR